MDVKPNVQDIIILKVKGEQSELKVGRSILEGHSFFFKEMFASDPECKCIELSSETVISFDIMKRLIDLMTSNRLNATSNTVCDLLHAADNLQVESRLITIIANDVTRSLSWRKMNIEVVKKYLKILNHLTTNSGQLNTILVRFVMRTPIEKRIENSPIALVAMFFDSVMFDPWVLKLNFSCIQRILSFDHLAISEKDAFITIKLWIQHDYKEREQYLVPLLKCIRFDPEMEPNFILKDMLRLCRSVESKKFIATLLALRLTSAADQKSISFYANLNEKRFGYHFRFYQCDYRLDDSNVWRKLKEQKFSYQHFPNYETDW